MTPYQIGLVQHSYASIDVPVTIERFYSLLFEAHPELRSLFPDDLDSQKAKLRGILDTVVSNLAVFDALVPSLVKLGVIHVAKGVKREHFGYVADALLQALRENDPSFAPEVQDAWVAAYTKVVDGMNIPVDEAPKKR